MHLPERQKIISAANFARIAHQGQVRKITGMPYIVHPARIASRVMILAHGENYPNLVDMVEAAFLHDTVEDTYVTLTEISALFGSEVARIVNGLTNQYSKNAYPKLIRAERKKLESERLAALTSDIKIIKMLDRIDNLSDMSLKDSFLPVYLAESKELLNILNVNVTEPYAADFQILWDELKTTIEHLELLGHP